ncbi:MAG: hypothetical protein HY043_11495 [Verrucomicrobia bacterium]|nr:hypothetical protein [Verrucomicrobiota bacterium]
MKLKYLSKKKAWPAVFALIFLLGWIDWKTGYELNFFVFYFAPVYLAAWNLGLSGALAAAVTCGFVWYVADFLSGHSYSSPVFAVWNTFIRLTSFVILGLILERLSRLVLLERERSNALRRCLYQIKVLEGLLPICTECKQIRSERGEWRQIEYYMGERMGLTFSHGYCPECEKKIIKQAGFTHSESMPVTSAPNVTEDESRQSASERPSCSAGNPSISVKRG